MSASRSFACCSKQDAASRFPCCVSSTTRARRSVGLDLRITNPSFSRRSTAAVIEPLARSTLSWISEIVSGPLCNRLSSAAKSVRHSPAFLMLSSARRVSARWLLIRTSQSRGAEMLWLFLTRFSPSYLGLIARPGRQQPIDRSCPGAADHQKHRDRKRQKVILETLSLLRSCPVREETEPVVNRSDGHHHVAKDSKGRNSSEQAEDQAQSPEKFCRNRQKSQRRWDVHHSGEETHRALEAISSEPSQHLLRAMR